MDAIDKYSRFGVYSISQFPNCQRFQQVFNATMARPLYPRVQQLVYEWFLAKVKVATAISFVHTIQMLKGQSQTQFLWGIVGRQNTLKLRKLLEFSEFQNKDAET